MTKRTTGLTLSYAADFSSSEDEKTAIIPSRETSTIMPVSDSGVENAPGTKRRGRPPAAGSKIIDAKVGSVRGRRASAGSKLGAKRAGVEKKSRAVKRPALREITNAPDVEDVEEVDDFDVLSHANVPDTPQLLSPVVTQHAPTRAKAVKTNRQPLEKPNARKGRGRAVAHMEAMEIPETQVEEQVVVVQSKLARTQSATVKKPRPAKRETIPETQPEAMEIEETSPVEQKTDPLEVLAHKPSESTVQRASSVSRQPRAPSTQRRAGSASDTERYTNDPSLRRKMGDLTKKLESLEVKYIALRDLGIDDAETAFDKLKKSTDEKTKAANELISSLRAEIKTQAGFAAESASLRAQLATLTTTNASFIADKKSLQSALQDSQNEVKALHAKLAAGRASSASIQSTESNGARGGLVPGSAVKGGYAGQRTTTVLVGSVEAAKEAQKRVLKEELYSDLTGLILRDVKRREEQHEDVYDCIQTGRNGTLHFHLTLAHPAPPTTNSMTPHHHSVQTNTATTVTAYEDAEFQYTPLLDPSRDADLMDTLPDYLTEEICFPRSNAAKFYARVVDCLTKRVVVVEEEDEDAEEQEATEEGGA